MHCIASGIAGLFGLKGDYVFSIEGNTNVAGGREGVRVFPRLRHKRTIAKYADWIRPVSP